MQQLLHQKREHAWSVSRKQALLVLFGPEHAVHITPLNPEELQEYVLPLFSQAIRAHRFTHGTFIEDQLEALSHHHGWGRNVPYADAFAAQFARTLADHDLLHVAEYLYLVCRGYDADYPTFFQTAEGGYRYLCDVLVQARFARTVPATPSLDRAIAWLTSRADASEKIQQEVRPPAQPLPRPAARLAADNLWAGIVAGSHTRREVEAVLVTLALLEYDDHGKALVTTESRKGGWIGATLALQQYGLLTQNKTAVARVFHTTYGKVLSARALQTGLKADNEVQNGYYTRACGLLKQP